jgi:hypothetical protein
MFFALAGTAQAQEKSGVFGSGGTSANEGPFEFEFDGGVKVVFDKLKIGGWQNGYFYVAFIVTSPEDMIFKISKENCIAYDNKGNEFYYNNRWIGNRETSERRIIGGVPTSFGFYFDRNGIELAEIYSRIDVNIMGKVVTMRNVPSTK